MNRLPDNKKNYAVGMFLWRRSSHIHQIISAILIYKPSKLYLFFDGPRNTNDQNEINKVQLLCKEALANAPFEVIVDAADVHFGLNKRFRTGLQTIFTNEPAAIILEDDTIPSPSFFDYCSFYLSEFHYREDILAINGFFKARNEFVAKHNVSKPFTNYIFNPWGWASWSHKFLPLYNPDIKSVSFFDSLSVFCLWGNLDLYQLRRRLLRDVESNKLHTWDVQLQWSIFLAKKKVLTPPVNLVKNVGNDSLASTFVAGKSDFEQDYFNLPEATLQLETSHLPSYDIELCRSKSNLVYIKNKLRNIKGKLFF